MKESASPSEERQSLAMTRRRLAKGLPGLLCLFGALRAGSAFAEGAPCAPLAIDADASVRARWPGLEHQLCAAFDGRADIDRGARVELSSQGAAVTIDVALPDGRSAARSVSRREDVAPTLEALLVLPEREVDPSPEPSATPVPLPAASTATAPRS